MIVAAPGGRQDGKMGVRGWRAFCECGWLEYQPRSYRSAEYALRKHRNTTCPKKVSA